MCLSEVSRLQFIDKISTGQYDFSLSKEGEIIPDTIWERAKKWLQPEYAHQNKLSAGKALSKLFKPSRGLSTDEIDTLKNITQTFLAQFASHQVQENRYLHRLEKQLPNYVKNALIPRTPEQIQALRLAARLQAFSEGYKSPLESKENLIEEAYLLRKNLPPEITKSNRFIRQVWKHEMALRLGVSWKNTKEPVNAGFSKWALKHNIRLDANLDFFDHFLSVHPESGEILFHRIGETNTWSEFKPLAEDALRKREAAKQPDSPIIHAAQVRYYGEKGPTFLDTFDPATFAPIRTIEKNGECTFELYFYAENGTKKNHAYWMYRDGVKGELWVFTIYRDKKMDNSCSINVCNLVCQTLDVTFPNYPPTSKIIVKVSKEELDRLVQTEFAAASVPHPYQILNFNCMTIGLKRLEMLGATKMPDPLVNFWKVYAPLKLVNKVENSLPEIIKKIAHYPLVFFGNTLCLLHESTKLREPFKTPPSNPYQSDATICPAEPWSLLNKERLKTASPYYVIKNLVQPLEKWKEEEKMRLREQGASEELIKSVDQRLPPDWWESAERDPFNRFQEVLPLQSADAAKPEYE